ncbi:bromoperoxidase [Salipiger pacificus]|uniref:Bromoperoxidase n=2 Tax=Salipiger mangrovisoli TaxID=2865933 RepID=A0ABR9X6X9_9RHOB|nr:bromoperoxidase [Salipiger mangrovisoli]
MPPSELAAEIAELYALALIRDVPFAALQDPHHAVWIDGSTRFTLHELLCEMRSLGWFERRGAALARESEGSRQRRAQRLNREGQLTLGGLYSWAVAGQSVQGPISLFHWVDRSAPELQDIVGAAPDAEAPMSAWVDWVARQSGAALAVPTAEADALSPLGTPRELVARLQASHPCRVYYNAALMLLARGTAFDPGLSPTGTDDPVSAQRVLALMAEAAERAFETVMRRQARADRLSPPMVTAARLGILLARGDAPLDKSDSLHEVADELQTYAPNLLHWITRMNQQAQKGLRGAMTYLLPELTPEEVPPQPSDSALQVVVAGALSTLFKALFDTRPAPRLRMATDPEPGIDIGGEADRLAVDIALSRTVCGAQMPAETHQNLRIGEALALQVLQGWMLKLAQGVSMEMTDFDGCALRIESYLRSSGEIAVALRRDGRPVRFPMVAERASAHLAVI